MGGVLLQGRDERNNTGKLDCQVERKSELLSLPIYECPIFSKNVSFQNKQIIIKSC